jgi:hypothetical protein
MYSHVLLLAALAASTLAGSPAAASSVELHSTIPIANPPSIRFVTCSTCTGSSEPSMKPTYTVPELAGKTQMQELTERNGKKALVRTEALMGGSPVTFVSLSPVWIETEQAILAGRGGSPVKGDGVDLQATTSAVGQPVATPATIQPTAAELTPADPVAASPIVPDFSGVGMRPGH